MKPSSAAPGSNAGLSNSDYGKSRPTSVLRSPASIRFVRNRIFYARAALNAKGKVRFGLRHIHVLNRYPNSEDQCHTLQILMYIFPRQIGLHNVFTSPVDNSQTAQSLPDYTLRESEIAQRKTRAQCKTSGAGVHPPRRLRGNVFELVQKMQKLHSRCTYYELLKHYCPLRAKMPRNRDSKTDSKTPGLVQQPPPSSRVPETQLIPRSTATQISSDRSRSFVKTTPIEKIKGIADHLHTDLTIVDHATPYSSVSALCRAVLTNLIPSEFWGQGVDGAHNKKIVMCNVDRFIRLRRFESLTLHAVAQDLKVL
ncbi:MAG: hypothetical protein Q9211_004632 [Gyalolechia sp. 1 TL-2023]